MAKKFKTDVKKEYKNKWVGDECFQFTETTTTKYRVRSAKAPYIKGAWLVGFIILIALMILVISTYYHIGAKKADNNCTLLQSQWDKWQGMKLSSTGGLIQQQDFTDATGFKALHELREALLAAKNALTPSFGLTVTGIVISTLVLVALVITLIWLMAEILCPYHNTQPVLQEIDKTIDTTPGWDK